MNTQNVNSHIVEEIREALEKTTLTKTIEPDAYADAAQQFIDEYGTDLHMILGEDTQHQQGETEITAPQSSNPAYSVKPV